MSWLDNVIFTRSQAPAWERTAFEAPPRGIW